MTDVVMSALRMYITSDTTCEYDRRTALEELEARIETSSPRMPPIAEIRRYRESYSRIETVKFVREKTNYGLLESLILVKGIEVHFGIE